MEPENVLTDDPTQLWAWDNKNNRFMKQGALFSDPWQPVQLTPEQQADPRFQYDSNRHRLYRDILDEQQFYTRDWKYQSQRDKMREELEWQVIALQKTGRYKEAKLLIQQFEEAVDSEREMTPTSIWGPISAEAVPERNKYIDGIEDPARYSTLGQVVRQRLNPNRQTSAITEGVAAGLAQPQWPNNWNPEGSSFGYTRNGGLKFHSGQDFKTQIGTPITAVHSGEISGIVNEQPNRIDGKYPLDYTGKDKNGAGNRITIDIKDRKGLQDVYWHLQAENPIAINPRTGAPFAKGDLVFMGDTIGYAGITGNPDPARPHLHYGVRKPNPYPKYPGDDYSYVDPMPSMNAIYDKKTNKIIYPRLKINR